MKKVILSIVTAILLAGTARAQDAHFSQFHAMPLYLNPAMTGFFDGDIRIGAIYRNQWFTIKSPGAPTVFQTTGAFVDGRLLARKLKGSFLGVGAGAFYDQAGDLGLNNLNATVNLAYSQRFGRNTKHSIALGLQAIVETKSFGKTGNAIFSDGITENINRGSSGFDVGVGLRYHVEFRRRLNMYFAGGYTRILGAKEQFSEFGGGQTTYGKITAHAGALIDISDRFNMMPQLLFLKQGPSLQVNVGTYFQYMFGDVRVSRNAVSFGLFARFAQPIPDAVIAALRLDYGGLQFGFAYDFNVSDLRRATTGQGAAELSLIYIIKFKQRSRLDNVYCPRF